MKPKPIKLFNIGSGASEHYFIGAHSKAHAVRLLNLATDARFTIAHFEAHASHCWGNPMRDIAPAIGVWSETPRFSGKVTRLL